MRIFISAGEPSGDLHGANLIRVLRRAQPDIEITGFGGDHMAAAGCRLLYPLCQLAVMWFVRVLANLHVFLGVLSKADRWFRHHKPDAVILIDYPGLHWWLARRAHFHGIPVFYFVPPQLWAWAGWRVKKMQRWVDHVLCSLPFEEPWYRERGVAAHYVGHPYFDELTEQSLDEAFIREQRQRDGPIIGLLPGSRNQEVANNFPMMVQAAERLAHDVPGVQFIVANYRDHHRAMCQDMLRVHSLPIECHVGRTAEIIHVSDACVAVSGSVSLELLQHAKPTVVVYKIGRLFHAIARRVIRCKYISLVNLLADRPVFPEYPTTRCEAEAIAGHLRTWLTDADSRRKIVSDLTQLRAQFGPPGACERAARYVLDALQRATPAVHPLAA